MQTRRVIQLSMAVVLFWTLAVPAQSGGAEKTSGEFQTLSGGTGLGYEIAGSATMIRIPAKGGQTRVVVHVTGLTPNTTYGSHVHNAPCAAPTFGGGHYQDDPLGGVNETNEIWPTIQTNAAGVGLGKASHGSWARPEAQAIVIHEPGSGTRIACLDLS